MYSFRAVICWFSLFFFSIQASEQIRIYTLPKSGSQLIDSILKLGSVRNYNISHLYANARIPLSKKRVVNIRDLRDYFASLKSFSDKVVMVCMERGFSWTGFKPLHQYYEWLSMTDDEKLMALITMDSRIPCYEGDILHNILLADEQVKQSFSNPDILLTRYESWIGEKGGGSYVDFSNTVTELYNHFGYQINQVSIKKIYDHFYGNSGTFDQGKIGRWKSVFKPEHIAAFKQRWNGYLIDWGYETEVDWE